MLCAVIVLLVSFFAVSIVASPRLPLLNLQEQKFFVAYNGKKIESSEPSVSSEFNRHPQSNSVYSAVRYAFMADMKPKSLASFKKNADHIDALIPSWLEINSQEGDIKLPSPRGLQTLLSWIEKNAPAISILPLIGDTDNEDMQTVIKVFNSATARTNLLNNIKDFVTINKFNGVVFDFNRLPLESRDDYIIFIKEAASTFHSLNLKILATVPSNDPSFDYDAVSDAVDHMILRIYDEHSQSDEAGPLAGQAWFESQLDARLKHMDGSKFVIAIGSYAYDWAEHGDAREIAIPEAWDLLKASQSQFSLEPASMNATFSYENAENGEKHTVWLLDAVTAYNQTAAALAMDVHGIALWKLGTEDPSIWAFFRRGRIPDITSIEEVKTLPAGYVIYRGKGEALQVTSGGKPGERTLRYDPKLNLVTDEKISAAPEALTITRWGAEKSKKLAITFDDGPDPKFTGAILDILAEKQVKACFFVIGANASSYPSILGRIYKEGHDIGNHTFTHPDLTAITHAQIELELNATQRLLEAELGINTLLFRPPYGEDLNPETVDHAQALVTSTGLGYTTVGITIDPHDWANLTKKQIVSEIIAQANRGEGNVILLHDAGGNRSQTIAALPELIDQLREQGYEFVTVHELLGLDREAVMPPSQPAEETTRRFNALAFGIVAKLGTVLSVLFFAGLILGVARILLIGGAAVFHWRRSHRKSPPSWQPASIAVIVPAYNEQETVCKTVDSLLAATLQSFEIIVVDDGSKDDTLKVIQQTFDGNERVRILSKPNGGKSSALNFGIQNTDAEIVIALDADTIFAPDAIEMLVRHFADERVGAVAGKVIVGNKVNLLTEIQALEYIVSQNFDRRALEIANGITVVPGAIGAWRREALLGIGGFPDNTLAEDADATISLECAGWRVLVEPKAIARTEAPETLKAFTKQRFRWMFGMLQVAYKHRDVFRSKKAPGIAYCAIPNIVLFQFLLVMISPVMDLVLVWKLMVALVTYLMHPTQTPLTDLNTTLAYLAALQILEIIAAAVALKLDGTKIELRYVPILLVQRLGYRQLLAWIAIKAAMSIIKGQIVNWGKLARTGNVGLPAAGQAQ